MECLLAASNRNKPFSVAAKMLSEEPHTWAMERSKQEVELDSPRL